jgi:aspartate aminotransferase
MCKRYANGKLNIPRIFHGIMQNANKMPSQMPVQWQLSSRVLGIEESQTLAFEKKAKDMKRKGIDVVSLSAGEPDFPTPANIGNAAKRAIDAGFTKYTETGGIPELRQAICGKLKRDNNLDYLPENIAVSCGAKHTIYNLCQAVLNKGDEVIIPVPYWVSYPEQVRLADATPVFVSGKTWSPTGGEKSGKPFGITAGDIRKKLTPRTKMIMLNSPSNPTGRVLSGEELAGIARLAVEKQLLVMSDEIYEHIIYGMEHVSIASLGAEADGEVPKGVKDTKEDAGGIKGIKELTITVNGISKSYSMTGWRIGYAAGPAPIIKAIIKLQSQMTSNPSSISQMAAVEALNGSQASVEAMRNEFRKRRDYVLSRLREIPGIGCEVPDGAFYVFPDISRIEKNSMKFAEALLEKAHVAVVPGSAFGMEGFIRISYATSMENLKKGLDRIAAFVRAANPKGA